MPKSSIHFYRYVGILLFLSFSFAARSFCAGVSIKIRVLNFKTGKPFKKTGIFITLWDNTAEDRQSHKTVQIVTTDDEGWAVLQLPEPIPEWGNITLPPTEFRGCGKQDFFLEEVLRTGTTTNSQSSCGKLNWSVSPKPGEIVILTTHISRWKQMLQEIP